MLLPTPRPPFLKIIRTYAVALIFLVVPNLCGCRDPQDPGDGNDDGARTWPEEAQIVDVILSDNAVEIDEEVLAASLVLDADTGLNGTYRFSNPPAELASLSAGRKTILAGLDIVTVTSVPWDGSDLILETSPAVLTDVISDGEIYWSRAVSMQESPAGALYGFARAASLIKPQTTIAFNGPVGQFEVQYSLNAANDTTELDMTAKIGVTPAKFAVAAKATVNQFHTEGTVRITDGTISYLEYIVRDIDLTMNVQFGGVETGKNADVCKLPLTLRIPAPIGILPTWIGIGGGLEFKSTLVDNTSTTGSAKIRARGTYGVRNVNGDITFLVGSNNVSDVTFGSDTTAVSTITSGLGIVFEFPKISLGVGASSLSGAVYTSMKNEVLTNFEAQYDMAGTVPVLSGSCYTGSINTGFYVGAESLFFGLAAIKEEGAVWVQSMELFKEGTICK
jgi:hypothetical protein